MTVADEKPMLKCSGSLIFPPKIPKMPLYRPLILTSLTRAGFEEGGTVNGAKIKCDISFHKHLVESKSWTELLQRQQKDGQQDGQAQLMSWYR